MQYKNVSGKKVMLVRNAYRYDFGGAERFPINLALELCKYNYQPLIVSRSEKLLTTARQSGLRTLKGWWWSRQNWSSYRVILLPLYLIWQIILSLWYLVILVRRRPDVVHLQSKDDFIAGTFAAKLLSKRVIWTDHADLKYVFLNHRVWYKNPVGKLVLVASRLADVITLVSRAEKEAIEQALGYHLSKKYRVIHNGVSDTQVTPAKIKSSPLTLCSTSRLVTAKGIGELIDAFALLLKDCPKARLLIVGEGPEEVKFRAQAKDIPNIEFIGYSDNALAYVKASDIFVHPSYHEGLSLSIVEAAMLAKPIIACDTGGSPEIIKDSFNGLLVPPKDVVSLAQAMLKLGADSSLRQQLGLAARQTFESEFDFNNIVRDKFRPLYEEKI